MGRGRKLFTHWSGDLRTNFAIVRLCSCASGSPLIWYYTSAPGKKALWRDVVFRM